MKDEIVTLHGRIKLKRKCRHWVIEHISKLLMIMFKVHTHTVKKAKDIKIVANETHINIIS